MFVPLFGVFVLGCPVPLGCSFFVRASVSAASCFAAWEDEALNSLGSALVAAASCDACAALHFAGARDRDGCFVCLHGLLRRPVRCGAKDALTFLTGLYGKYLLCSCQDLCFGPSRVVGCKASKPVGVEYCPAGTRLRRCRLLPSAFCCCDALLWLHRSLASCLMGS